MFEDFINDVPLKELCTKYKLEDNRVLLSALHFVKKVTEHKRDKNKNT